jgi:hypothetical protein
VREVEGRALAGDVDEAVGVFERKRMENDGIDDAEDGGVGADAER